MFRKIPAIVVSLVLFCFAVAAQTETLSNADIISMTESGLSRELIARKIKDSKGAYDTSVAALIALKKAGVADEILQLMMNAKTESPAPAIKIEAPAAAPFSDNSAPSIESRSVSHVRLDSKEALRQAKTIAITKSTINPSRQALEKELLKRKDWQSLNLNLVRYKQDADLYVEIGFVPLSIITHRYVYRIYDNKSGTVIAAGETTSWGSLAENLARSISKKLALVSANGK